MFHSTQSEKVSVIFLAGGKGARMGSTLPKQYLPLAGKPLLFYSLDLFLHHPEVGEVIIVCAHPFRSLFRENMKFADPGERRQDSVYNGLQQVSSHFKWVAVHDGVRPFITQEMISSLFLEGKKTGVATLGVPIKATIKEVSEKKEVIKTWNRELLWEIQTPQFLNKAVMEEGFAYTREKNLTVTDYVSLAEMMRHPVKIVEGSYQNIKITTPEDLRYAEISIRHCL